VAIARLGISRQDASRLRHAAQAHDPPWGRRQLYLGPEARLLVADQAVPTLPRSAQGAIADARPAQRLTVEALTAARDRSASAASCATSRVRSHWPRGDRGEHNVLAADVQIVRIAAHCDP